MISSSTPSRPQADEHHPYYAKYIALTPESDGVGAMQGQLSDMMPLLSELTEEQGGLRYAPGKWSIRQVLQHVIDAERVFAYRALRAARGDRTPLPGFDENAYAETAGADTRTLQSLADEWIALREANLAMFRALDPAAWLRRTTANDNEVSVRALAFIIAGHGRHHCSIIRDRYLAGSPS